MEKGSCMTHFVLCSAAAVASDLSVAPKKTPCCQLNASQTRGTPSGLRPPRRIASILTPFGSSQCESMIGQFLAGVQNRELGWAGLVLEAGVQSFPIQSICGFNESWEIFAMLFSLMINYLYYKQRFQRICLLKNSTPRTCFFYTFKLCWPFIMWFHSYEQCSPLNRITLGQLKSDNINRTIQLTVACCL